MLSSCTYICLLQFGESVNSIFIASTEIFAKSGQTFLSKHTRVMKND